MTNDIEPEIHLLGAFLAAFNHESDRGAALVAASMLDDRLHEILAAFMLDIPTSKDLLSGFHAPLGTFAARSSIALSLGLIQLNEFEEITIVRKIRNEFGHGWKPVSFDSGEVVELCNKLPWLGPKKEETGSNLRSRFNFLVAILLADLMWRTRLVVKERCTVREWPHKSRD